MGTWSNNRKLSLVALLGALSLPCAAPADVAAYRARLQEVLGLVDYYALDGNLDDQVDGGNGMNHGQVAGPPGFEPGVRGSGQAAVFNGRDQFLRIARSIQDSFTILAWIKTDVPGAGLDAGPFFTGSGLIYADVGGEANDFGTAINGSTFGFGVGNPGMTIHSVTPVTSGEWVQVAAVRTVDLLLGTAEVRVYVNGVLEESMPHANLLPLDGPISITMGGNTLDRRYYAGSLDEVALIGAALDDAALAALHAAMDLGLAGYRQAVQALPGLVDYYDFEGTFDDTIDGGNGLNNPDNLISTSIPSFAEGVNDQLQAGSFDGLDDFFPIARSIQDDFTILAWIKTDLPGIGADNAQFYQGSGLIYADVPGGANDFGTALTGSTFAFGLGNPDLTMHSVTLVADGQWHQVAAVRELPGAGGPNFRVYVDGALEAEGLHGNAASLSAAMNITIGGNTVDNRYYAGLIDEVALFNAPLDGDTIQSAFNSMVGLEPCFTVNGGGGNGGGGNAGEGPAPFEARFDAACTTSVDAPIVEHLWDFGDGQSGNGAQVTHVYAAPGRYPVRLTVRNQRGGTASIRDVVTALFPSGDVSPWTSVDIGEPEPLVKGGARREGACLRVYAGGRDIAGTADQFHFVHQRLSGDAAVVARIAGLTWSINAKIGVMIREDLTPGSRHAMLGLVNAVGGRWSFLRRQTAGGTSSAPRNSTESFTLPDAWVKIERKGGEVIGWWSRDGIAWTELGRAAMALPDSVLGGIAATARDTAGDYRALEATVCDLSVTGAGSPPAAPTGLAAAAGDGKVDLDWADSAEGDLLGYNVYRGTAPGGPHVKVNAAPVVPSAYSDAGLSNGTPYHYVVRALGAGGESPPSAEVSATPGAGKTFRRGDLNTDQSINLTDAINLLGALFLGQPELATCRDAADVDDSGNLNLTDAIYLLSYSFQGGDEPPAPGPKICGLDPSVDVVAGGDLGCLSQETCVSRP